MALGKAGEGCCNNGDCMMILRLLLSVHNTSNSSCKQQGSAAACKRQLARAPNIFIDYSESSSGSCSGLRCEIIWTKTPGMSNNNA